MLDIQIPGMIDKISILFMILLTIFSGYRIQVVDNPDILSIFTPILAILIIWIIDYYRYKKYKVEDKYITEDINIYHSNGLIVFSKFNPDVGKIEEITFNPAIETLELQNDEFSLSIISSMDTAELITARWSERTIISEIYTKLNEVID